MRDVGVPVPGVRDRVEVVAADALRQVAAPVVGIATVDHAMARIDGVDPIGACPDRNLEAGLGEGHGLEVLLRKDGHETQEHGKLPVVPAEVEGNSEWAEFAGARDAGKVGLRVGTAVIQQGIEGEEHVIGHHLRSVMEPGAGIQVEDDSRPVVGDVDGPCQLGVERERLVGRSIEQRLKDKRLEATRGKSLDDVGIHAVERADDGKAQVPALARLRIDPWKVVPGAVGEGFVAVHREGVSLFCARRHDGGGGKESDRCGDSCSCDETVHGRPNLVA